MGRSGKEQGGAGRKGEECGGGHDGHMTQLSTVSVPPLTRTLVSMVTGLTADTGL